MEENIGNNVGHFEDYNNAAQLPNTDDGSDGEKIQEPREEERELNSEVGMS